MRQEQRNQAKEQLERFIRMKDAEAVMSDDPLPIESGEIHAEIMKTWDYLFKTDGVLGAYPKDHEFQQYRAVFWLARVVSFSLADQNRTINALRERIAQLEGAKSAGGP